MIKDNSPNFILDLLFFLVWKIIINFLNGLWLFNNSIGNHLIYLWIKLNIFAKSS